MVGNFQAFVISRTFHNLGFALRSLSLCTLTWLQSFMVFPFFTENNKELETRHRPSNTTKPTSFSPGLQVAGSVSVGWLRKSKAKIVQCQPLDFPHLHFPQSLHTLPSGPFVPPFLEASFSILITFFLLSLLIATLKTN